VKRQQTTQRN